MLAPADTVLPGPEQLLALAQAEAPGVWRLLNVRPQVPLSRPALLTNASGDPKLGNELRAELATADRVDLLCAFVKWYGLRVLEAELKDRHDRGVPHAGAHHDLHGRYRSNRARPTRARLGAQVRVNYETRSTRLHAKAWLFRRHSGFSTAYVGSSNLSRAALLDGLEWNVRLAAHHTPELLTKFEASFDTYWQDPAFVPYDPDLDAERLDDVLAEAGGRTAPRTRIAISGLAVRPYPHQSEMLDRAAGRARGARQTPQPCGVGDGDRQDGCRCTRLPAAGGDQDRSLLFVAHRQEILEQSLRTYREVLGDGAFGELYVGGQRPERWRHVFASVQSLAAATRCRCFSRITSTLS